MDLYKYEMQLAQNGFNEESKTLSHLLTDANISINKREKLKEIEDITLELIKEGKLPPVEG